MVIEKNSYIAGTFFPLIAYVMKSQTGGLWICGVPNKLTICYKFPAWLN